VLSQSVRSHICLVCVLLTFDLSCHRLVVNVASPGVLCVCARRPEADMLGVIRYLATNRHLKLPSCWPSDWIP